MIEQLWYQFSRYRPTTIGGPFGLLGRNKAHLINRFVRDARNAGNGAIPLVGLRDAVKSRLEIKGMTCR